MHRKGISIKCNTELYYFYTPIESSKKLYLRLEIIFILHSLSKEIAANNIFVRQNYMLLKISALEKAIHNSEKPTHFPQQKAYLNLYQITNGLGDKPYVLYKICGCSKPVYSKTAENII